MTDEQKNLLDTYLSSSNEDVEFPSLAPNVNDLAKPCPVLHALPLTYAPNPEQRTWEEFWQTGLPTMVNSICTVFGWALAARRDENGNVVELYPVRTNSRGLCEEDTEIGLGHLSRYLAKNAQTLHEESYVAENKLMDIAALASSEQIMPQMQATEDAFNNDQNIPCENLPEECYTEDSIPLESILPDQK